MLVLLKKQVMQLGPGTMFRKIAIVHNIDYVAEMVCMR